MKKMDWGMLVPFAHLEPPLVLNSQKGSNAVKFTFQICVKQM